MSSLSVMVSTLITLAHYDAVRRGHPRHQQSPAKTFLGSLLQAPAKQFCNQAILTVNLRTYLEQGLAEEN
jgi:hypothetical protein